MHTRSISLSLLTSALFSALFSVGCSAKLGDSTDGENGRVELAYGELPCLFGCSLDRPMMRGTTESIHVWAKDGNLPVLDVRSTDTSVVVRRTAFLCCKRDVSGGGCRSAAGLQTCDAGEDGALDIAVEAAAAGHADLVLTEASGEEWDRATVEVAEPARLDLTCAYDTRKGDMSVGDECALSWTPFDGNGRELRASTGVKLTITPREVAAFHHIISANTWSEDGDQSVFGPSVIGLAAGTAEVTAAAGKTTGKMVLEVRATPDAQPAGTVSGGASPSPDAPDTAR
jgi:hypothetical protein